MIEDEPHIETFNGLPPVRRPGKAKGTKNRYSTVLPEAAPEAQLYLRPKQAAYLIGLTEGTLNQMRLKGEGPPYVQYVKAGAVLYEREALLAWLNAHTITPGS